MVGYSEVGEGRGVVVSVEVAVEATLGSVVEVTVTDGGSVALTGSSASGETETDCVNSVASINNSSTAARPEGTSTCLSQPDKPKRIPIKITKPDIYFISIYDYLMGNITKWFYSS